MARILIVEPDTNVAAVIADILPEKHASFSEASGDSAKARMLQPGARVDLVITANHLPEGPGTELVDWVKLHFPQTPIILMSGLPEPAGHQADAFLAKPFDNDLLKGLLTRFLG